MTQEQEKVPEIHQVIRSLTDWLGPSLLGELCGLPGAAPLRRWLVQPPDIETEAKLRIGYDVFQILRKAEGVDIARAWMIGMNPHLVNHDGGNYPDGCPTTEIGLGYGTDVLAAARAYVQDPSVT
jgi:hypothetical protein